MTRPSAVDLIQLLRAPAALSVPGDVLAGASAANWPFRGGTAGLATSSICLYWAGMALNDYADRELDAVERPERPIPSGRISPGFAFGVACGLTAAGLGLAAASGGRRALGVALPLAATIWAYDCRLKSTPFGCAAMGLTRSLDVLLGAGPGRLGAAALPAITVGLHTFTVTTLSRHEVSGTSSALPMATLLGSGVLGVASVLARRKVTWPRRLSGVALACLYVAGYGRAQWSAAAAPTAGNVRRAVGAGIHATIPLQAALTATAGSIGGALGIATAFPLARLLGRKVSAT
jgi:4-hydroxybenzoate polyprenyltransferase